MMNNNTLQEAYLQKFAILSSIAASIILSVSILFSYSSKKNILEEVYESQIYLLEQDLSMIIEII